MARSSGEPIGNYRTVKTVGPQGPVLFEDHVFIEDFQHMARSRNMERIIHARGTGLHGYFEVTNDISRYCDAKVFAEVGKRTPVFARFSIAASQLGVSETAARGGRGFAFKLYTEEGNLDMTLLSEPVFIINDTMKVFSSANAGNLNPHTNMPDPNMGWDFISQTPESVHFVLWQYSDTGYPDGYRFMNTFGLNTYRFVNRHGETVFARYSMVSEQGVRNLTPARASQLAGSNPDYSTQDLMQAIDRGDFPSYKLFIQLMTTEQSEELEFNPFDVTMIWPQDRFPSMEVGRVILNRIVQNHWDETEQVLFNPSNLVPGILPSPDKVLAGRMMSYQDAQIYRLGVNRNQLPINRPLNAVKNYQREGRGVFISQGAAPNYFPNSFGGPVESERAAELEVPFKACGQVRRAQDDIADYFTQPRQYWQHILDEDHKTRVLINMATSLKQVRRPTQERTIELFSKVDQDLSNRLRVALGL